MLPEQLNASSDIDHSGSQAHRFDENQSMRHFPDAQSTAATNMACPELASQHT